MFVYRRTATVVYSRLDYSILFISSLSDPQPFPVSVASFFTVYDALFQATDLGPEFNLAFLIDFCIPTGKTPLPKNWAFKYIRNFLALPLHFCQANFLGSGVFIEELTSARTGLLQDMYTNVSIAEQSYRVVPGTLSLWLFGGLTSFALLVFLMAFIYSAINAANRPRRTGFPSLDLAINCVGSETEPSLGVTLASLRGRDETFIMKELVARRAISKEHAKVPLLREVKERTYKIRREINVRGNVIKSEDMGPNLEEVGVAL